MFSPNDHLIDLKGKQYLQVMWRLVWFREEHPLWNIDTKLEQLTENHAVFSAKISDENGAQKASGYGSESVKDFRDFIEKAETKAIGRALATLGYGTQFAPELEEGERIVDSPVATKHTGSDRGRDNARPDPTPEIAVILDCADCGGKIKSAKNGSGEVWEAADISKYTQIKFQRPLCIKCMRAAEKNAG